MKEPIYAGLPVGSTFGWGILGKYVVLEMAGLADVRLLMPPDQAQTLGDEIDFWRLRELLPRPDEAAQLATPPWRPAGAVIQACFGAELKPFLPQLATPSDVGFAVFEEDLLTPEAIDRGRKLFRHLATGSTYCAEVLRAHGLTETSVVLHGVDPKIFHPDENAREILADKFVIFSGGKFELRKAQDVVIRAYKVLQDRHPDVVLVNSWYNQWPGSRDTMRASKLIRYTPPRDNNYTGWVNELLAANGIDVSRVLTVGMRDNRLLARIYHNTDIGLFPNRVEGGTNMVMMEYMACGKPVVGAFNSGHKDILTETNARLIRQHRKMPIVSSGGKVSANWSDPNLDETIEHLEWAYQHRDEVRALGRQAGQDLAGFTWRRVAAGLVDAVRKVRGTPSA
ncbi:MAG: glycosyltransferase family 4 protein [Opitutae bacterium]|nr:glycosyltransferase family 4 protein [Opitutae bacterium]